MKSILIVLLIGTSLLFSSCSQSNRGAENIAINEDSSAKKVGKDTYYSRPENPTAAAGAAGAVAGEAKAADAVRTAAVAPQASLGPIQAKNPSTQIPQTQIPDRKIIRNGEFLIKSKKPNEDQNKIAAIAESFGGFVVTSEFQQADVNDNFSSTVKVIVRVPGDKFAATVEKIRGIGEGVLRENISGQDVTEEFVDLEARVRAKKALEAQILDIMKRAGKISDALEVQEKLTEVRTEIEQLEGRRRFLENQSALSTITATLQTSAPVVAATKTGFWASIQNSFGDGVDIGVGIILGFIHFVIVMLPIVVLILLPAAFVGRMLYRKFRPVKAASITTE